MTWNDARYALRVLTRQPAFTLVAVITLALGIGANTAIFTLFNAILLESLPVREPTRLVVFSDSPGEGTSTGDSPSGRWNLFSFEVYDFLRRQPLPFESLAAVRSGEAPVSARVAGASADGAPAERAQAHLVSGNYFDTMGTSAAVGRLLTAEDDDASAAPAAVVSYGFWSQRLHSDSAVTGKIAILNGTAFTIVGVTAKEFFGERVRRPPDFWVPLAFQPQVELSPSVLDRTDTYWLNLIGRLSAGTTRDRAQVAATSALRRFLAHAAGTRPSEARRKRISDSHIELADGAAGVSTLRYLYSEPLHILLGVVGLVLLIACANVGNLLLSRAAARHGEMAVRAALGATRARLVRQLLTESMLLAALGAVSGVLLAHWVVKGLLAMIVSSTAPVHAALDAPVLVFTIALTGLAGLLFGTAPALAAGRVDLVPALKSGGRGRGATAGHSGLSLTRALVVSQIAISLVLLVGANLFGRSLLNLEARPLGFDQDHVLLARVNPRLSGYKPADVATMYRRLYDRMSALPGVRAATLARYSPLGGGHSANSAAVAGYAPRADEQVELEGVLVGPSYPETLGMTLLTGREIGVQDGAGSPKVAMVNEAFARHFFPNQNPIGHRFGFGGSDRAADIEIVGVLGDARFQDDREAVKPMVFTALLQDSSQFALDAEIEIRTAGDPSAAAGELRQAVAEVDPSLPVNDSKTLRDQVSANLDSQRLAARLVGAFGALALLLACVGLYGIVMQSVERRTNEIGVRMALGAQRGEVVWMILRDTLVLLAVGIAAGVPTAFGAARFIASQLYGVSAAAPASFALAAAVLTAVAVATGVIPARRASRVDPVVALRSE